MNKREFSIFYPALSGTLGCDFQYPYGRTDEEIARTLREDLPSDKRIKLIHLLLGECAKLMLNIDSHWEVLSDTVNRSLDTPEQARDWLARIMAVWEQSLREIDDAKPP